MSSICKHPRTFCRVLPALLLMTPFANAATREVTVPASPETIAFARYVQALRQPDPFGGAETVAFSMSAALPELYKAAVLTAVRKPGEIGGDALAVSVVGDGAVVAEVISRCLDLKAELYKLPVDTLAIDPDKYRFRFAGEVNTGTGRAYRYTVVPRKADDISITGSIWMDASTGREVVLVGHVRKAPKIDGPVNIVRDTKLREDGAPLARVTHLTFSVDGLGRAEVEFVEYLGSSVSNVVPLAPNAAFMPDTNERHSMVPVLH